MPTFNQLTATLHGACLHLSWGRIEKRPDSRIEMWSALRERERESAEGLNIITLNNQRDASERQAFRLFRPKTLGKRIRARDRLSY